MLYYTFSIWPTYVSYKSSLFNFIYRLYVSLSDEVSLLETSDLVFNISAVVHQPLYISICISKLYAAHYFDDTSRKSKVLDIVFSRQILHRLQCTVEFR